MRSGESPSPASWYPEEELKAQRREITCPGLNRKFGQSQVQKLVLVRKPKLLAQHSLSLQYSGTFSGSWIIPLTFPFSPLPFLGLGLVAIWMLLLAPGLSNRGLDSVPNIYIKSVWPWPSLFWSEDLEGLFCSDSQFMRYSEAKGSFCLADVTLVLIEVHILLPMRL